MEKILEKAFVQALGSKMDSVLHYGELNNRQLGRGLLFFLYDADTFTYTTGYLKREDVNEENLRLAGFGDPATLLKPFVQHADRYVYGFEFALIAANRVKADVTDFSAMTLNIEGMRRLPTATERHN